MFIKLLSVQFTLVVTKHWRVNTHHHCVSHLSVTAYVITHVTVGRLSTLKLRKWLASHSLITVWVSDTQSLNVPFSHLWTHCFFSEVLQSTAGSHCYMSTALGDFLSYHHQIGIMIWLNLYFPICYKHTEVKKHVHLPTKEGAFVYVLQLGPGLSC